MRIRKRTPARAASPPPTPMQMHEPKEVPGEEGGDEVEEKRVILVAGTRGREDGRVVPVASKKNSATDEPEPRDARCSRNDGKRWRCKNAAVPGFLFCDLHVKWSTRQRQSRAGRKQRRKNNDGGGGIEPVPTEEKGDEEAEAKDKGTNDNGFAA